MDTSGEGSEVKTGQEGAQRGVKGWRRQLEETLAQWTLGSALQVNVDTSTVGVVTEARINNVAERNRMQILPYIRVYRGLAGAEQTLSFSALPSG